MTNQATLQRSIFPLPKLVEETGGTLGIQKCRIEIKTDAYTAPAAASLITQSLSALGITVCDEGDTAIILQSGPAPAQVAYPEQGYELTVSDSQVILTGFGETGLYYGAATFVQLAKTAELPCCRVLDWPDMPFRCHKVECRFGTNVMEKQDWMDLIDELAMQKISHIQINVYGCWCVQYDGKVSEYLYIPIHGHPELQTPVRNKYYDPASGQWIEEEQLPPMYREDFFGELVAYGKARGIKVYAGFNSYGHNTLIPRTNPNVSAKEETGKPTLFGYCTANPETYELLFGIYDQIIDRYLAPYGSDCFCIMLDEVWAEIALNENDIFKKRSPWCKCPQCRDKIEGELFVNHALRCIKHLKEKGMKRIVIDCDMLIDHGPNGVGVLTDLLVEGLKRENLEKDVLVCWWTYADLWEKLMFHSTKPELGLARFTSPWNGYYAWCCQTNPMRGIYMMAKMAHEEGCDGMASYTGWDRCHDRNNRAIAEFTWSWAQAGSIQDMTDRYVQQHFPTHAEAARRAFQLFDFITEERIDQPEGNSSCLANYFMLRDRLSYYFYSYVEEGKPYPRIFPGEALQKVCARREDHVRAMYGISGMAKEALAIWETIARDPSCDQTMAAYYAYEADNYRVLVDDYLAMLRMMELADTKDYGTIMTMAAERRDIRLALMARLQSVKADYLHPFQLRNHSIFMQFFEDLRTYLATTPEAEIHLDFFDMRYLASDRFMNLR